MVGLAGLALFEGTRAAEYVGPLVDTALREGVESVRGCANRTPTMTAVPAVAIIAETLQNLAVVDWVFILASLSERGGTPSKVVRLSVSWGRAPVAPSGLALLGVLLHLGFASQAISSRPYRD